MDIQHKILGGKFYRVVNETFYDERASDEIIKILEESRINKTRLIFDFGNIITGESWGETFDTIGHIGRSSGTAKIPLLIKTKRSLGGGGLLSGCIVKITTSQGKRVLYQHESYKPSKI